MQKFSLPIRSIPPIPLQLFDGLSRSFIQFMVTLPVSFSCGKSCNIPFYVTSLDNSASAVLGYDWLSRYNPLVDWAKGLITFQNSETPNSSSTPVVPDDNSDVPSPDPPLVSLIGAAAFICACQLPGSVQMCRRPCSVLRYNS